MSAEPRKLKNPFNFFRAISISAVIILLWVVPVLILLWQAGTPGSHIWGFISIIALLATIISPLVYGWFTRDSTGAVIIGALPFLLVTGISWIFSFPGLAGTHFLVMSVVYILSLSLIGGLGFAPKVAF